MPEQSTIPVSDAAAAAPVVFVERRQATRRSQVNALTLLLVANIADFVTTVMVWQRGGHEANPFAARLAGAHALWPAKAAVVAFLVYAHRKLPRSRHALPALWFVAGLYTAFVVVNAANAVR